MGCTSEAPLAGATNTGAGNPVAGGVGEGFGIPFLAEREPEKFAARRIEAAKIEQRLRRIMEPLLGNGGKSVER
jgi:hypothetical protein